MKTKVIKATRIGAAFALLGAIIACGGDDEEQESTESATTEETEQGVAAAQPGAGGGSGEPQPLQLGQAPVSIQVPVPPSFNLQIEENGEYQIDVTGGSMDPEVFIYQGDQLVEKNDDGGDGLDSRVVRFMDPGTYSVRVVEHRARPFTAQVSAQRLDALEPVGALTLGEDLAVTFPDLPLGQRARNDRDAAKAVTLNIASAGQYTCTAAADNGRDAKMALIQDGRLLEEDDDGGEGNNASITRQLQPGDYVVRVWDWIRRDEMTITVNCRQG